MMVIEFVWTKEKNRVDISLVILKAMQVKEWMLLMQIIGEVVMGMKWTRNGWIIIEYGLLCIAAAAAADDDKY